MSLTERSEKYNQHKLSRRTLLLSGSALAAIGAGLLVTGRADEVVDYLTRVNSEPLPVQEEAYRKLVVEQENVLKDLIISPDQKPVYLLNKPVPSLFKYPGGDIIAEITTETNVGSGVTVMGTSTTVFSRKEKAPWLAIVNPNRKDKSTIKPVDIVFSPPENFDLTQEQLNLIEVVR